MGRPRGDMARWWQGVRLRRVEAAADPDAPACIVTLPAAWDDAAAVAACVLAGPGAIVGAVVGFCGLADTWLAPLAARAGSSLAERAQALLLRQMGAPEGSAWGAGGPAGRYRLNVSGLAAGAATVDEALLAETIRDVAALLGALWPEESRRTLVLTGLDGLLAGAGLDYASAEARALATAVVRQLRAGLTRGERLEAGAPDPIDALLGVETAGIAPAFGPLDGRGALSRAARARLAARGMSAEAALAACLVGDSPLAPASPAAHAAMDAALRPLLDAAPALPPALRRPPATPMRRELPRRRGGLAQRASVGGHKVYLVTGEYDDGTPGEISVSLPQASPAVRALAECLGHAIGIGLQHGAPLEPFVDALVGTRFGPAGAVEGDPLVAQATSAIDYVARTLAASYLPELSLPQVQPEQAGAEDGGAPLLLPLDLPLGLPREAGAREAGLREAGPREAGPREAGLRRRGLRVVK